MLYNSVLPVGPPPSTPQPVNHPGELDECYENGIHHDNPHPPWELGYWSFFPDRLTITRSHLMLVGRAVNISNGVHASANHITYASGIYLEGQQSR